MSSRTSLLSSKVQSVGVQQDVMAVKHKDNFAFKIT